MSVMYCDPSGYAPTMSGQLTSIEIASIITSTVVGAIYSYWDAKLSGEYSDWECFFKGLEGAGWGTLFAVELILHPEYRGIACIYGIASTFFGAIDSFSNKRTGQGILRSVFCVLSVVGGIKLLRGARNPQGTSEPLYRTLMRERGIPSTLSDEEIATLDALDYKMSAQNRGGFGNYQFKEGSDIDLRGGGTLKEA